MTAVFDLPPVDREQVRRYAGMREMDKAVSELLEQVLTEFPAPMEGKVCWQEFPLKQTDTGLDLTFARTEGTALRRHLSGCDRLVVFAATAGLSLDRQILRYSATAPAKAVLLQAVGAERIEALCDVFQAYIREAAAKEGKTITDRFSPGYGDFPLEFQREIFRVLDCPRQIGLTLNESLLMTPTKSVTALIGMG